MNSPRILYITTETRDEARRIGNKLVKDELCACANIIKEMESIYCWKGELQNNSECILLIKTTSEKVDAITEEVLKLHSYDVPCIISLPLSPVEGNSDYLDWIADSVK